MSYFSRLSRLSTISLARNESHPNKLSPHTISTLTGTPEKLLKERVALIYKPSRHSMQSGSRRTKQWVLEFDRDERWSSPLMGWTGSADPVQALSLTFNTVEEATQYAEKNGMQYVVDDENAKKKEVKEKSYADNFKYRPPKKDPLDI